MVTLAYEGIYKSVLCSIPSRVSACTYPSGSAVAVYILLELLDAFVEVVVVVRADVDENAAAEHFTQLFGAGPVVCNVAR
jgi:hypothetical protein